MQFADILKGAATEGKEKHVPTIELLKDHGSDKVNIVHVVVGKETPHPNTIEHHIAWLEVFGVKKDGGQVVCLGRAEFGSSFTQPHAVINVEFDQFTLIAALSYCNLHGLWQSCIDV